jgi:quercetin dioxygenase-like cupin family protein
MYKSIMIINAIFLLTSPLLFAQSLPEEIDPVAVSSNNYKILLENEYVRVVEYQISPGEKEKWHTHPAKVSYVLSGGSLKITTEDGESFVVEEEANSTRWFGAVGKHYGENVGKTPIRIIFVEVKNIDASKEDLDRFQQGGNTK